MIGNDPSVVEEIHAQRTSGRRGDLQAVVKIFLHQPDTGVYILAIAYTGLGDKDKAFERLQKMYALYDYQILFLKADPYFDPLRPDPRFTDLLRRMGLQP